MHGRLKVKTTEQQERERKKEKDAKQKKYIACFNTILSKRCGYACDDSALSICAQLLLVNPDALSIWNYRREIIQTLRKLKDKDDISKLEQSELAVTENCLMSNHKSYGAWHQRHWILSTSQNKYWNKEMEVCDQYLAKDERNFHCWDHRRIVASKSQRTIEDELKYTQKLIEENLSNYSAWHYRSKLLPIVHPSDSESPCPVEESIFIEELKRVISAIFTDPNDQSPWFFLRWLLAYQPPEKQIVQFGIINGEETKLVLVCNSAVESLENFQIEVSNYRESSLEWIPDSARCIWSCHLALTDAIDGIYVSYGESQSSVHLKLKSIDDKSCVSHFLMKDLGSTSRLSNVIRESLDELYENLIMLDSVEPGNKWVLLTMVDTMWSLDSSKYLMKILDTLGQLRTIDCLRDNYYRDMGSKFQMEVSIEDFLKNEQESIAITNLNLSRVVMTHLLCLTTRVDFSKNNISCLKPLSQLLNCRELILDNNILGDLDPLLDIPNLEIISLQNCGISSVDQIECFIRKSVGELKVYFSGNLVPELKLKEFLGRINNSLFIL